MRRIALALLLLLLGTTPALAQDHATLAREYAPILYHDVDDSKLASDLPTRFDFDGNTRGDDNWKNFDRVRKNEMAGDKRAFLYWDVLETETHWFISYSVFHPQDWDDGKTKWFREAVGKSKEHENDLEPILVVVEKTPTDPLGRMVLLETQAHGPIHAYGDAEDLAAGTKKLEGPIVATGRHPHVFIEAKGHGIYGKHETLTSGKFPGGDGFVFAYGTPEDATSGKDSRDSRKRNVGYGLLSTKDHLWPLAQGPFGDGQASDGAAPYSGGRFSASKPIGFKIQSKEKKADSANWPWGQDDGDDGPVGRGDWFFDPAYAVSTHFAFKRPVSRDYVSNPYLDDLGVAYPKARPKKGIAQALGGD